MTTSKRLSSPRDPVKLGKLIGESPPLVVAFDLATATGVCLGRVGEKPKVTTWDLRVVSSCRPCRLLHFSNLCDELFRRHRVDYLRYEAPLPIALASTIGASEDTMLLLRGLIGVLECCGARAGILDINSFDVKDARHHLTGRRTFPRANGKSEAKIAVMKMAHLMGVDCHDDNSADAYCGWSYTCAILNPRLAPLFAGA